MSRAIAWSMLHKTHYWTLRCRSNVTLTVQLLQMPHLLNVNSVSKHRVSFSRPSLPVCEYCAVEALKQVGYAVLYKLIYLRLAGIPAIHLVIVPFNRVSHILNSDWLALHIKMRTLKTYTLAHVAYAFLRNLCLKLRSHTKSYTNLLTADLAW